MTRGVPASKYHVLVLSSLLYLSKITSALEEMKTVPLLMPNIQPVHNGSYLCIAYKTSTEDVENLVEIYPKVNENNIHHVGVFGCVEPGGPVRGIPNHVWNCKQSKCDSFNICRDFDTMQLLYTWSEGTLPMKLPHGVAFRIGKDTGINYLVLQIHYTNVDPFTNDITDNSGTILKIRPASDPSITKSAGILALVGGGYLPSHEEVRIEIACRIEEPQKIYPVSFQPHTHHLGKVVAGYVIDHRGKWRLLGKKDPMEPQYYYPVKDKKNVIKKGDIVAARCTSYNSRDHDVQVGTDKVDEMCDFYLLYYVNGNKPLDRKFCFSPGPPEYYWKLDDKIKYIPPHIDADASTL